MPNALLNRISLPNLRLYTSVSVVLVSCCLYYAISATSDPFWRLNNNTTASDSFFALNTDGNHGALDLIMNFELSEKFVTNDDHHSMTGSNGIEPQQQQQQQVVNQIFSQFTADQRKLFNDTRTIGTKFKDVVSFMVQEPICVWVSYLTVLTISFCMGMNDLKNYRKYRWKVNICWNLDTHINISVTLQAKAKKNEQTNDSWILSKKVEN